MIFGRQKRQKPDLQRRSSDESYSSTTSLSKTHRRTSSFNGWSSIGAAGPSSDVSVKTSTTKATDPLNVSWSSSGSGALSNVETTCCSPESSIGHASLNREEDKSMRALELIRQLSFSPSRKTRKRTDTAGTASSSSFDCIHKHNTSPIGLDLKHLQELRMGSPSPLVGLQYLPDGHMSM
jgi:hypothetical protein